MSNEKKQKILHIIGENLNFCDTILMRVFKNYTIRVYRIGLNDAFYWNNKKQTSQGCNKAVIYKKKKYKNKKQKILKVNGE